MAKREIDGFVLERAAVICPQCQSPFSTEILVESRKLNSSDIIEADLHRVFSDPQIRAALLTCCPACEYTAWTASFKPFKVKPELLRKEAKIEPCRKYALAVKSARAKKIHSLDTAFIAINGLWCARECGEADNLWVELAIYEHVKGVASSPSCPQDDGMTHLYLAELYRQHRDFDKALAEYDLAELDPTSPKEVLAHQRMLAKQGNASRTALPLKVARLYFEVEDCKADKAATIDFTPPEAVDARPTAEVQKNEIIECSPAAQTAEAPAAEAAEPASDSADASPLLAAISSLFSEKGSLLQALGSVDDVESTPAVEVKAEQKEIAAAPAAKETKAPAAPVKAPAAKAPAAAAKAPVSAAKTASAPAVKAPAAQAPAVKAPAAAPSAQAPALRLIPQAPAVRPYTPSIGKMSFGSAAVARTAAYPTVQAVPSPAPVAAVQSAPAAETQQAAAPQTDARRQSVKDVIPPLAVAPEASKTQESAAPQKVETKPQAEAARDEKAVVMPRSRASVITAPPASSVSVSISVSAPAAAQKTSVAAPATPAQTQTAAAPAARTLAADASEQIKKPRAKRAKSPREDFYFARYAAAVNVLPNRNGWKNDYVTNQTVSAPVAPVQSVREEKVESTQKPAEQVTRGAEPQQVARGAEPQQVVRSAEPVPQQQVYDASPNVKEAGAPLPGLAIEDPIKGGRDYSDAINRVESYLSFSRRVYSRNWAKL